MILLNGMVTVVAGAAGHGRSSHLLSELYKRIVSGQSVLLFTETPKRQILNKLTIIHSGHPKFGDKRRELGIIDCLDYKSMYTWQVPNEAEYYTIIRADFPFHAVHIIETDDSADVEALIRSYYHHNFAVGDPEKISARCDRGPSVIAIDCSPNYDCGKAKTIAQETDTAVVVTHQMGMDAHKKAVDSRCSYSLNDFSENLKYNAHQLITVWHENHPFLPSYKVEVLFTKGE